jgi:hypothetical protein
MRRLNGLRRPNIGCWKLDMARFDAEIHAPNDVQDKLTREFTVAVFDCGTSLPDLRDKGSSKVTEQG